MKNQIKEKILKAFDRKYHLEDDWDSELYQDTPSGWKNVNKDVRSFLLQALEELEAEVRREVVEGYQSYLKNRLLKGDPRRDDPGLHTMLMSWFKGYLDSLTHPKKKEEVG